MRKRILLASALVGAIVCALAAPASAHVTVDPPSAPKGGTVKLSFLAPNEEPSTKMTELAGRFPTPPETPIPTVTVEAKPGWTVTVTTTKLAKPIVTDDGNITDIVSEIDWKAKTAADGIAPEPVRRVHDRRRRPARQREPGRVQGDPDLRERQTS